MNPYDPPWPIPNTADDGASKSDSTVAVTYILTPDHLIETLTRYRSQHFGRRVWRWGRYAAALMFLMIAVAGLFIPQYGLSAFMLALTAFMFFPHKIDDFLARRNFHKSPHCNTRQFIQFSDEGLQSSSEVQESTLKWAAFSRAVIFDDGVLIFQGPKMVHWIPDGGLEHSDDAVRLRNLVISKLPTTYSVRRRGRHAIGTGDSPPAAV